MSDAYFGDAELASFGDKVVNLKREDVDEYREQVNRLRDKLTDHIKNHPDYSLVKMLNSGSVAKGTALRILNDMDVAVYVKAAEAPSDEKQFLQWLKDRLQEAYSQFKPEQFEVQMHCVTLKFVASGLNVDVVPVLYEGGANDCGFLIVKSTGERVLTSIPLHLEFVRKRKKNNPVRYAQLVRFIKWWARERRQADDQFRFKSFVAELICAKLTDTGLNLQDYTVALERVFAYIVTTNLKTRIAFTDYYELTALPKEAGGEVELFDPVNPKNNVTASYTKANREAVVSAAADALDAITEARYATTKERATDCWKRVFGPLFKA
jgi:tRNA nucleotidyltransferase (CCA-adding enzyme)